jgi:hypothetical protein
VSVPEAGTAAGAVYTPAFVIVPEAAVQDTVELKLPLPATAAEHWLVWPICMLVGEQETVTDEITGD